MTWSEPWEGWRWKYLERDGRFWKQTNKKAPTRLNCNHLGKIWDPLLAEYEEDEQKSYEGKREEKSYKGNRTWENWSQTEWGEEGQKVRKWLSFKTWVTRRMVRPGEERQERVDLKDLPEAYKHMSKIRNTINVWYLKNDTLFSSLLLRWPLHHSLYNRQVRLKKSIALCLP